MGPGRWSGGEGSLEAVTEHRAGALQVQREGRSGQIGKVFGKDGERSVPGCLWDVSDEAGGQVPPCPLLCPSAAPC